MNTLHKSSVKTQNHDEIREWVIQRNGKPAIVNTENSPAEGGILRIQFDDQDDHLKVIGWEAFFQVFDREKLTFLYDTDDESLFNKFIR